MPSDYDQIRAENIKEYGEGTRHLAFLGQLYSKRTHFVFELLQNAEDAGAKRLEFRLWQDRLEVLHDGRIFNKKDVRGICGVGEGTKAEDLTKIGKFGVGFKSVYAYVKVPSIHSGDEHFLIEHYVRPRVTEPRIPDVGFTTLIILPFDGAGIRAGEAVSELKTALSGLDPTTLLFLRSIELVIFKCEDQTIARFSRKVEDEPSPHVRRVKVEIGSDKDACENWLLFERPVVLKDEHGRDVELRVEVAFRLQTDLDWLGTGASQRQRVVAAWRSPLVAFFPTEVATNFGFLIQGPYRTTPARDNVPEFDSDNVKLIQNTGELVVEALRWLQTADYLTVEVLLCLPINRTQFPEGSMFRPIFESVREALLQEKLVPAFAADPREDLFEAGASIKAPGSDDLRRLVSRSQLSKLYGTTSSLAWVSSQITVGKTPPLWDYLRRDLSIEEMDADGFVRRLTEEFLINQSDEWMGSLYAYLAGQRAWLSNLAIGNRASVPFVNKPIIRLEDGRHVCPLNGDGSPSAFLPSEGNSKFYCVKREIVTQPGAKEFLTRLKFVVPDECDEVLQNVLPKYSEGSLPNDEEYRCDLASIFAALKTDSTSKARALVNRLKICPFVCAENAATGLRFGRAPTDVYFRAADLETYFHGNSEAWFVSAELEEYRDALRSLGAAEKVRITGREPRGEFLILETSYGNHKRSLHGFDPDCKVHGLTHALSHPSLDRSAVLWNTVLGTRNNLISGWVLSSSRKDFSGESSSEEFSEAGKMLAEAAWLPDRAGCFRKAHELSPDDLPMSFVKNETLSHQLRMRLPPPPSPLGAVAQLAQSAGVSIDDIEYLKNNKVDFETFKLWQEKQKTKPERPDADLRNPTLREERIVEQAQSAGFVERHTRERAVRVNWDTKEEARTALRELNTNSNGQMVCQICLEEMPFKLDDGSYFFEAVQCVRELKRELPQNYIALCPICAAMFKHVNGTEPIELKQRIVNAIGSEVPVTLARKPRGIIFTRKHIFDLRTALKSM